MVHRRILTCRMLASAGAALAALVCALCPLSIAHAGSPFDDPQFALPQGGGSSTTARGGADLVPYRAAPIPAGYTELPLPSSIQTAPFHVPTQQDGGANPNEPSFWARLGFAPSKWLLDSTLGAITGFFYSVSAVFQSVGLWALGGPDTPSGYITNNNLIFQTPLDYTINRSLVQTAMTQVMWASLIIMVLIATYRGIKLITNHHQAAVFELGFALFGAMVLTCGAKLVCGLLITAANGISARVLAQFTFGDGLAMFGANNLGSGDSTLVSLVIALVTLVYWGLLAYLVLLSIARLVWVNLLVMVSPLAGLSVLTGGGWNYASVWFFRLLELLLTPVAWGLVLGFMRNLIGDFGVGQDQLLSLVMGTYVLFLIPKAPKVLGLAAREVFRQGFSMTAVIVAARTAFR